MKFWLEWIFMCKLVHSSHVIEINVWVLEFPVYSSDDVSIDNKQVNKHIMFNIMSLNAKFRKVSLKKKIKGKQKSFAEESLKGNFF